MATKINSAQGFISLFPKLHSVDPSTVRKTCGYGNSKKQQNKSQNT
jgi:hypothetical protein